LTEKPELAKMKVSELRTLAKRLGIEASSTKTKTQLIRAIQAKERAQAAKPKEKAEPAAAIEKIQGIFVNYRQGMFSQNTHSALIRIPGISSVGAASKYIGRKVIWQSQTGKQLTGKLITTHGQAGILLARFKRGLPGQALGTEVEII